MAVARQQESLLSAKANSRKRRAKTQACKLARAHRPRHVDRDSRQRLRAAIAQSCRLIGKNHRFSIRSVAVQMSHVQCESLCFSISAASPTAGQRPAGQVCAMASGWKTTTASRRSTSGSSLADPIWRSAARRHSWAAGQQVARAADWASVGGPHAVYY